MSAVVEKQATSSPEKNGSTKDLNGHTETMVQIVSTSQTSPGKGTSATDNTGTTTKYLQGKESTTGNGTDSQHAPLARTKDKLAPGPSPHIEVAADLVPGSSAFSAETSTPTSTMSTPVKATSSHNDNASVVSDQIEAASPGDVDQDVMSTADSQVSEQPMHEHDSGLPDLRVHVASEATHVSSEVKSSKRSSAGSHTKSPRKSKRARHQTPKAEAACEQQIGGFRQRSPSNMISHHGADMGPGVVILAPIQARSMNRKLPKGYKLVPLFPHVPPVLSTDTLPPVPPVLDILPPGPPEKRHRKQSFRVLDLQEPEPVLPPPPVSVATTPKSKPGRPKAPTPLITPARPKAATAPATPSVQPSTPKVKHPPVDDKANRLELLQKKLELLKQRQCMITARPSVPTPTPKAGKRKRPEPYNVSPVSSPATTPRAPRPTPTPRPAPVARPPKAKVAPSTTIPRMEPPPTPQTPYVPPPTPETPSLPISVSTPTTAYAQTPTASSALQSPAPVTPGSRRSRQIRKPAHLSEGAHSVTLSEPFRRCRDLILHLMKQQYGHIFSEPVDWEKLNLPDYPLIIKNPMDLGTIKNQLISGYYHSLEAIASDVRLVWANACQYNKPPTLIYQMAQEYSSLFEKKYSKIVQTQNVPRNRRPTPAPKAGGGGVPRKKSASGLEAKLAEMEEKMLLLSKQIEQKGVKKRANDDVALTRHEKKLLKDDICKLPASSLQPVINMIREASPGAQQGDSIVIDIDQLDTLTLRNLQRHVKQTLSNVKRKKSKKQATPSRPIQPSNPISGRSILTSPAVGPGGHSIINSPSQLESVHGAAATPQASRPAGPGPLPPFLPSKPNDSDSSSSSDSDSDSDSEDEVAKPSDLMAPPAPADPPTPSEEPKEQEPEDSAPATETQPGSEASVSDLVADPPSKPAPASSQPTAASAAFGDPDNALYSTTLPETTPGSASSDPKASEAAKDEDELYDPPEDVDPGAWSTLDTAAESSKTEESADATWSNFQSKDQEKKQKERERMEQEKAAREELARKAEERRKQLEAEERQRVEEEEARKAEEAEKLEAERAAEEKARKEQLGGALFGDSVAELEAETM